MAETEGLDRISEELTGQPPTNSQRKLLLRAMRAVGLRPDDPFLPLFVALGYHQRLYEEIPGKVAAAAKAAAAETRSAAKAAANAATQESLAALTAGVVESAQAIAGNKAETERLQARSGELKVTAIAIGIVMIVCFIAFVSGYRLAQEKAKAQQPMLTLLQSNVGQHLLQLKADGSIDWLLSSEGQRARELSGDGSIDWLLSSEGQRARELSGDGSIDWLLSSEGKRARELSGDGSIDWWLSSEGQEVQTLTALGIIDYVMKDPIGKRLFMSLKHRHDVGQVLIRMLSCDWQNAAGQPSRRHGDLWCRADGTVYWPTAYVLPPG